MVNTSPSKIHDPSRGEITQVFFPHPPDPGPDGQFLFHHRHRVGPAPRAGPRVSQPDPVGQIEQFLLQPLVVVGAAGVSGDPPRLFAGRFRARAVFHVVVDRQTDHAAGAGEVNRRVEPFVQPFGQVVHVAAAAVVEHPEKYSAYTDRPAGAIPTRSNPISIALALIAAAAATGEVCGAAVGIRTAGRNLEGV